VEDTKITCDYGIYTIEWCNIAAQGSTLEECVDRLCRAVISQIAINIHKGRSFTHNLKKP